tara:strand:- start:65 stop:217 length:153 start_codon:yes stop_codon:yes gene_type:complete
VKNFDREDVSASALPDPLIPHRKYIEHSKKYLQMREIDNFTGSIGLTMRV